jgi:hypothetical protein
VVHRLPHEGVGDLGTELQLGEHDVVLVDPGGREVWLPGPAAGGVTSCLLGESTACWVDGRGALLLVLATDQVVPGGTAPGGTAPGGTPPGSTAWSCLAEAAGSAGITVSTDPFLVPASGSALDLRHTVEEPGGQMTEWERGRIGSAVDVLVPLAGVIHLVGAVAAAYAIPPWGYLALAGSAVWLAVRLWAGLRYRRWRAGIRRGGAT